MPEQWIVIEDKTKFGKRWVQIHDTVNKIKYGNFFPLGTNDSVVVSRFRAHVKERRAEIESKLSTIDLDNFEQTL